MPELRISSRGSYRTGSGISSCSYASYDLFQRKRTLEEFPMEHSCADSTQMYARRRKEQEANKRNLVSTCGESHQLSSYGRKRFETALTVTGKASLPPPSPEDERLFWVEAKPSWTHRRHHSVTTPPSARAPSVHLGTRPGSEPPRLVDSQRSKESRFAFNHLRGNNDMYPEIKRLLKESNAEYRVVSVPVPEHVSVSSRRPSTDHSVIAGYLVPRKETHKLAWQAKANCTPEVTAVGGEAGRVDHSAEYTTDATRADNRSDVSSLRNEGDAVNDLDSESPSSPWRCWVDDATVSSIAPDPETETPTEDVTAPTSPIPEPTPELSVPLSTADVSKGSRLSVAGKQTRTPTPLSDKKDSATSQQADVSISKRKSSGKLKKKKDRKGTPEPQPVEVVELPPPPPPPPTPPPIVETVDEVEPEPVLVLPSYICPSSVAKSTHTEIKLWMAKSTFSAASRTLPIF